MSVKEIVVNNVVLTEEQLNKLKWKYPSDNPSTLVQVAILDLINMLESENKLPSCSPPEMK